MSYDGAYDDEGRCVAFAGRAVRRRGRVGHTVFGRHEAAAGRGGRPAAPVLAAATLLGVPKVFHFLRIVEVVGRRCPSGVVGLVDAR